ncbi:MAG: uncharacterized protein A8A55_0255 [Amphiamblys sp. WSBS2006]|nr:MAG: uncharacterized protein A8A55_0255 [Amphiamblys sp. WSBS2006]
MKLGRLKEKKESRRKKKDISIWAAANFGLFIFLSTLERSKLYRVFLSSERTDLFFFGMRNSTAVKCVFFAAKTLIVYNIFTTATLCLFRKDTPAADEKKTERLTRPVPGIVPPSEDSCLEYYRRRSTRGRVSGQAGPSEAVSDIGADMERWSDKMKYWKKRKESVVDSEASFVQERVVRLTQQEALHELRLDGVFVGGVEKMKESVFGKIIAPFAAELKQVEEELEREKKRGLFGLGGSGQQQASSPSLSVSATTRGRSSYPFTKADPASSTVEQKLSSLASCLPGNLFSDKEYVLKRLKELAVSGYVSRQKDGVFVSDGELIFSLVVAYLDSVFPSVSAHEMHPFSSKFVSVGSRRAFCETGEYRVRMVRDTGVYFDFCVGKRVYETSGGTKSLFEAFLYFKKYCEIHQGGFAGMIQLSEIGLFHNSRR